MPLRLQITLIIVSCLVFFIVLHNIRKQKMTTDLATIWILWVLGLVLISIFPGIVSFIGDLLGIEIMVHTVYLFMIFLLYVLVFIMYLKVSTLEDKLKQIVQRMAIEDKEKDE